MVICIVDRPRAEPCWYMCVIYVCISAYLSYMTKRSALARRPFVWPRHCVFNCTLELGRELLMYVVNVRLSAWEHFRGNTPCQLFVVYRLLFFYIFVNTIILIQLWLIFALLTVPTGPTPPFFPWLSCASVTVGVYGKVPAPGFWHLVSLFVNLGYRAAQQWREVASAPCLAKSLTKTRVRILLKSGAFLTLFRACFLPGRTKDLSAPR